MTIRGMCATLKEKIMISFIMENEIFNVLDIVGYRAITVTKKERRFQMANIAMQNISKICKNKLLEKAADVAAYNRLQTELDYIAQNEEYAEAFIAASELISYSRELGYYTGFHGCIGSSLVAFLLGITEIDPIKYNLPFEVLAGIHNDKKPDIELLFDVQFLSPAKRYVQENYPNAVIFERGDRPAWLVFQGDITNIGKDTAKPSKWNTDDVDPRNVIKVGFYGIQDYAALKELSDMTGVDLFGIPMDDKQTLNVLKTSNMIELVEFDRDSLRSILQIAEPKTFEDFVQVSGWWHSTYRCMQDRILEMPAFRDDVLLYLLQNGIDKITAYEIMERVRRGKGLTDEYRSILLQAGISKQYIENLNQVQYLFPKAHCICSTMTAYRAAWFEAHYPDEFQKVMKM